jgi:hypothetical protein
MYHQLFLRQISQAFTMKNVSVSEQVSKPEVKMKFKGGLGAIILRKR